MSKTILIATLMAVSAFSSPAKAQPSLKTKPSARSDQPTYMITAHTVVHDESTNSQLDNYVIVYGSEVLRVQYAESQISTLKPGASEFEQVAPGKNLHWHTRYGRWPQEPDVSQVPHIGVPIRACEMDTEYPDNNGHTVIAIQSVSAPCMSRDGDTLHYAIAPNGGIKMWEYVNFDILETANNGAVVAAQSAPSRKDIPAIAKGANGVVVSIITSDKDGHPVAQGTGFLVSKDGRVMTNYHVIKGASSAIIKLPDGAFYAVEGVVAYNKARDLAVIKAHGQNFRVVTLGDSDRVQVGQEIVAIGSPLSLESTVSNGIVSGFRTIEKEGGKFLQVTAPISPGSSGGPLFNMAGEVIGITTLYLEGGENLNFAIPVNDAKLLLSTDSKVQDFPVETSDPLANLGTPAMPNAAPAPTASMTDARVYYSELVEHASSLEDFAKLAFPGGFGLRSPLVCFPNDPLSLSAERRSDSDFFIISPSTPDYLRDELGAKLSELTFQTDLSLLELFLGLSKPPPDPALLLRLSKGFLIIRYFDRGIGDESFIVLPLYSGFDFRNGLADDTVGLVAKWAREDNQLAALEMLNGILHKNIGHLSADFKFEPTTGRFVFGLMSDLLGTDEYLFNNQRFGACELVRTKDGRDPRVAYPEPAAK